MEWAIQRSPTVLLVVLIIMAEFCSSQVLLKTKSDLSKWGYNNGNEFPGAKGNLTWNNNGNYAVLTYDFAHPSGGGPFDPQYIAGTIQSFQVLPSSTLLSLDFMCINSTLVVRMIDSTSQTFQAPIQTVPLELEQSVPSVLWHRGYMLPIQSYASYWGGANDGIFHYPLTGIWIIAQGQGINSTGTLSFTNVQLITKPSGVGVSLSNPSGIVQAKTTTPFAQRMGVNIHFTSDDRAMDIINTVGFKWIRNDFTWAGVENPVGTYNFDRYDQLVSAAESRGMQTLAILDYGHPYWTGGAMNPPRNQTELTAYGNYVFATVKHFIGRKVIFEVWNEPDVNGFWGGKPNPTEYARALITGLKRGHDAHDSADILTGGMSSPPAGYPFWDVIDSMNAAAGAMSLASHLYVPPGAIPELRWADLIKLGPIAKKLTSGVVYCTEWGFSSTYYSPTKNGHEPIGRRIQAQMAVRQMILAWWADLPMLIYYDVRDDGTDPNYDEHNFGLLANDYTDKPAMTAVRVLFSKTSGQKFVGLLTWNSSPVTGLHVAQWDNNAATTYVCWLEAPTYFNVTLSLNANANQVSAISFLGANIPPRSNGNVVYFDLTPDQQGPIYIQVSKQEISWDN